MSDKNQSSQEVQNFIRDAKNLYTSAVAMIKKTIADYKTPAEIKPTENSTPTPPPPPSANVIDSPIEQQPEQQPEQQTQQQPEQQSEQPPVQQSPIVDSESTTKDTENK